jgi:hypothetical protein
MIANSTARNIHLVRTARVAGEAFGYQAAHEGAAAAPVGWARRGLALLLLGFLATAAYLAL